MLGPRWAALASKDVAFECWSLPVAGVSHGVEDARSCSVLRRERQRQQCLLFDLVRLCRTGSWTRTPGTFHRKHWTLACDALQTRQHVEKRTHVGRFFLHPYNISC